MRRAESAVHEAEHFRKFPVFGHAAGDAHGCVHTAEGRADHRDRNRYRDADHETEPNSRKNMIPQELGQITDRRTGCGGGR